MSDDGLPSRYTSNNNNVVGWDSDLSQPSNSSHSGQANNSSDGEQQHQSVSEDDADSLLPSDNPEDPSYHQTTAKYALNLVGTPARNIVWREAVSEKTKERVFAAAPAGGRCLVTLVRALSSPNEKKLFPSDIAFCHAIEKALAAGKYVFLVRTAEWHFGMKEGMLNLNSRWNIILLRLDIHAWFDGMGFIFFPVNIKVLKQILTVTNHNSKCSKADGACNVYLGAQTSHILLSFDGTDGTDDPDTNPEWDNYPYEDKVLQDLESHLNPFYALYHARYQINQATEQNYIDADEFWKRDVDHPLFESLQLFKRITEHWYDPNTVPDSEFLGRAEPPSLLPIKSSVKMNVEGGHLPIFLDILTLVSVVGPVGLSAPWHSTRSFAQSQSSSSSAMLAADLEDVFSSQPASSHPTKKSKMSAAAGISSGSTKGNAKAKAARAPSDAGAKRTHQQAGLSPSL
ncbi:hypothetical protein BT96DRAFT_1000733 [Gymnopus androsaceus JB14]|uniref:HNH nuclease domain-containing protein n=1 Tax=Gymnopus androsaceus JB14 TaxID=1447944 RepID=A0A6A4H2U4_9AGAR|nr:hypothetical protein BT96DRAFT_1000733 [Gymnopus androsaceus JB14]